MPTIIHILHYTAKLIVLATLASPFWPSMQPSLNLLLSHWAVQRAAPDFPGSAMLHFLPHLWSRAALAAAHATIVTNKAPMKTRSPVAKNSQRDQHDYSMATIWLGFIWHNSGDIANKLRFKWYSPTARAVCWKPTRKLPRKLGWNVPQLLRTHVRTFLESCLENPQNLCWTLLRPILLLGKKTFKWLNNDEWIWTVDRNVPLKHGEGDCSPKMSEVVFHLNRNAQIQSISKIVESWFTLKLSNSLHFTVSYSFHCFHLWCGNIWFRFARLNGKVFQICNVSAVFILSLALLSVKHV